MPVIWAFQGDHAGTIVEVETQDEVDKAVAEGWGQDMAIHSGAELLPVGSKAPKQPKPKPDPEPIPDDPPPPPVEAKPDPDPEPDTDKAAEYNTRHLEAEQPRRGRPPKSRD